MAKKPKPDRMITIKGPLTQAEVALFWKLMQSIEHKRPHQRFRFFLDDRANPIPPDLHEAMDFVGDVSEGYARVMVHTKTTPKNKMN